MKDLLRPRHVALASVIVVAPLWAATSGAGAATSPLAKAAVVKTAVVKTAVVKTAVVKTAVVKIAAVKKAPASVCEKLNAVFSDGPDPDADPVGYALSQILPLGDVHTTDRTVRTDLTKLIAADRALVQSNGKDHTAKAGIKKDDHLVNEACPGVAP